MQNGKTCINILSNYKIYTNFKYYFIKKSNPHTKMDNQCLNTKYIKNMSFKITIL